MTPLHCTLVIEHWSFVINDGNRFMFVVVAMSGPLELTNDHSHRQPGYERQRKFEAVVGVKLKFRQKIAARDAKKRAGAERQRAAEEN